MDVWLTAGTVVEDRYELTEMVDSGPTSVTWTSLDRQLGRSVALKVLLPTLHDDPRAVQRFRREGRALASMSHPHIVAVYDAERRHDGERVAGPTLQECMTGRFMTTEMTAAIGVQVARGLSEAHAKRLVHRDVRPDSVIVSADSGLVRLAGFGSVKDLSRDQTLTPAPSPIARHVYLAPELLEGAATSAASDVYALGMVLRACQEEGGSTATRAARLDDVLASATHSDPTRRPSAADLAHQLAELCGPRASLVTSRLLEPPARVTPAV